MAEPAIKAQRFQLFGLGDLRSLPHREPLVADFMDRETLAALIGEPEAGKSAVALCLGMCIALGRPFASRATAQGTVVYLAAEGGRGLRDRLQALCARLGVEASNTIDFLLLSDLFDLRSSQDDATGIIDVIRAKSAGRAPIQLVIIDTLSASFGAGEENSSREMMMYTGTVREIMSALGCAALLLHHTPKAHGREPSARGHSSLAGNCESIFATTKEPGGIVSLAALKQKDIGTRDTMRFTLEGVAFDDPSDGTRREAVVAVALEDTPTTRAARLEGDQLTALSTFQTLAAGASVTDRHVTLRDWSRAFRDALKAEGRKGVTARQAFKRARAALERLGIIHVSANAARLAL